MSNAEAIIIFLYFATGTLVDFSYRPQLMAGVGFLSIKRRKMHRILFFRLEKSVFLVLF